MVFHIDGKNPDERLAQMVSVLVTARMLQAVARRSRLRQPRLVRIGHISDFR